MYTLSHEKDKIGTTKLERGDPSTYAVSGVFNNIGGAKALAGWIKSIGGEEDGGVVFIGLNKDFSLVDKDENVIDFADATLIAIPDDDEVFLDITGLSEDVYKAFFAEHLSALDSES
ncbi:hypothetical protein A9Q81_10475 [Gammaproteobacteria bacterium 42_54_T18]|nr:hypothetical protein A9Q81_10475 [Gammaproteobacteria bacterium 42_54_T18]